MEETFHTYRITLSEDSIWKQIGNKTKACDGGFYYKNDLQLMCVHNEPNQPCAIESKKISMTDFQGKNLKITLVNSGKACDPCETSIEPIGQLQVTQHSGQETFSNPLEIKSNVSAKVYTIIKNMDAITFTFSISRICRGELVLNISSTVCRPNDTTKDLIILPKTNLPAPGAGEFIKTNISCIENTVVKEQPQFQCSSDGSYKVTGSCQCAPNYELIGGSCNPCAESSYKLDAGNEMCTPCAKGSIFESNINKCVCTTGYSRAMDDLGEVNAECYSKISFDIFTRN